MIPSPAFRQALFLVVACAGLARPARAEAPVLTEVERAEMSVRDASDRADRLRAAGRPDLAKVAEDLVAARRGALDELRAATASEGEATTAESAHAEALKLLDRATSAREERRQRLARLADQLAQAEKELEAPAIVSMPRKAVKSLAAAPIDAPPVSKSAKGSGAKGAKP